MKRPNPFRGFTLVELLIVISLIGLLISLVLPALGHARAEARYAQAALVMRQMHASLLLYANDSRDGFPYFATPGDPFGPVVVNGVDLRRAQGRYYRPQSVFWPSVLRRYISGRPRLADRDAMISVGTMFGLPQHRIDDVIWTRFYLTYTAFSSPFQWYADKAPRNLSHFRGTRWDEVQFPSQKGILFDATWPIGHQRRTGAIAFSFAMADGSTARSPREQMNNDTVYRRGSGGDSPVLSTRFGLHGRDR